MCIFCKKKDESELDLIILSSTLTIVEANMFPSGDVSYLIYPKNHVSSISETTEEESTDLMWHIKYVVKRVEELFGTNYNVFWNSGRLAGQNISHLHCHVVLRTIDNGVEIKRLQERHIITPEELTRMKKIK